MKKYYRVTHRFQESHSTVHSTMRLQNSVWHPVVILIKLKNQKISKNMDGLLHNQFLKTMKEATTKSSKNYYLLYNNFMSLKSFKKFDVASFFLFRDIDAAVCADCQKYICLSVQGPLVKLSPSNSILYYIGVPISLPHPVCIYVRTYL